MLVLQVCYISYHYITLVKSYCATAHHNEITCIDFSHCTIKHDAIITLCKSIDDSKFISINKLIFDSITIKHTTWTILLTSINKLQHLIELNCSHTSINDTHLPLIGNLLQPHIGGINVLQSSMKSLDLSHTNVKCVEQLKLITTLCQSSVMTKLNLNHCRLSLHSIIELINALQCTNIRD